MSLDTKTFQYDAAYVRRFSEKRKEPDWLCQLRLKALDQLHDLPLPEVKKTRIKGWNFTDFVHDAETEPVESFSALPQGVRELLPEEKEAANLYVQRDSRPIFTALADELQKKGVIFTDLLTAVREHGDLVKKYFMKAVKANEHRLTALHAALVNGGLFLYVPKNVQIDVPLQAVFWKDDAQSGLLNHVLIVADDHSSLTYVENYYSEEKQGNAVANVVAEVYAGENARVAYGAVDHFANDVTVYVNRRGHAAGNGKIEWALGQMNEGNTIADNTVELIGDGSYTDVKAVAVGTGNQSENFVTRVNHHGLHSEGFILTHGVMKDGASAIFNGITKIEKGASKANGQQTERVLMLSDKARGDANPILLIDEDDVEAGHAASVGRVDPVQLYYLMSRGLTRQDAERLIIHGFLSPVVDELPIESVKKQLLAVIERKVR